MSFPAIERRGLQRLGVYRAFSSRSKVQGYFYILLRVLVQDNEGCLRTGKGCGVGGCVNSRPLELWSEVTMEQGPVTELSGELEAIGHGLHHIFRAERRDGSVKGVRMSCDLIR